MSEVLSSATSIVIDFVDVGTRPCSLEYYLPLWNESAGPRVKASKTASGDQIGFVPFIMRFLSSFRSRALCTPSQPDGDP